MATSNKPSAGLLAAAKKACESAPWACVSGQELEHGRRINDLRQAIAAEEERGAEDPGERDAIEVGDLVFADEDAAEGFYNDLRDECDRLRKELAATKAQVATVNKLRFEAEKTINDCHEAFAHFGAGLVIDLPGSIRRLGELAKEVAHAN